MTTTIQKKIRKQSPVALKTIEHYLTLSKQIMVNEPSATQTIRKQCQDFLTSNGLPTRRHEDWQYTPLNGWMNSLKTLKSPGVVSEKLLMANLPTFKAFKLVFIDGVFSKSLSDDLNTLEKGLAIKLTNTPINLSPKDAFEALYGMLSSQTVTINVATNALLETPIFITQLTTQDTLETVGLDVIVNEGAQCKIIQQHLCLNDAVRFNNGYSRFNVQANANCQQFVLQELDKSSFYFNNQAITQADNSDFTTFFVSLGSLLSRNLNTVDMDGEHCETSQNSLVLVSGKQVSDSRTITNHNLPHGNSNQLHKFVLHDDARGVFNGMIYVAEDAQKTDGLMDNKNLLLSNSAKMDTKPQLEIYADDVKCSHGCASGQIDKNQLFYCQARGIRKQEALALITQAFLLEPLELVTNSDVKCWLSAKVNQKLAKLTAEHKV